MRVTTAFFAGIGTVVVAIAAGLGGGLLLGDIMSPQQPKHPGSEMTRLERRMETTVDMTDYHTFREINALTPAAIIELGFMLGDRAILTEEQETLTQGISDGVLCYFQTQNGMRDLN